MCSDFYAGKVELVGPRLYQSSYSSPSKDFELVSDGLSIHPAFLPKVFDKEEQA